MADRRRDRGAFLLGADLTESLLDLAQLDRSSLSNARLIGAQLWGASLRGAELMEARLSGADLTNASLSDADLSTRRATFSAEGLFQGAVKGLTQWRLDEARADPENPPKLDGVVDAETGQPLVWRGKPLEDRA